MNIALEIGLNVDGKRGIDAYFHGIVHGLADIDLVNRYYLFTYFFTDYDHRISMYLIYGRKTKGVNVQR